MGFSEAWEGKGCSERVAEENHKEQPFRAEENPLQFDHLMRLLVFTHDMNRVSGPVYI